MTSLADVASRLPQPRQLRLTPTTLTVHCHRQPCDRSTCAHVRRMRRLHLQLQLLLRPRLLQVSLPIKTAAIHDVITCFSWAMFGFRCGHSFHLSCLKRRQVPRVIRGETVWVCMTCSRSRMQQPTSRTHRSSSGAAFAADDQVSCIHLPKPSFIFDKCLCVFFSERD